MSIKNWFHNKYSTDDPSGEDPAIVETQRPLNRSTTISLDEISLGMQHAATAANRLIAHQYMQALEPFFDQSEDGCLHPKMIQMSLDENHHFKLPLVAMATPRGLILERMKVFLTVCTETIDQQLFNPSLGQENISRFIVSLSPPSRHDKGRDCSHVDIEMEFTKLDPPESVMRVIEEYTRNIVPVVNTGGSEDG